MASRRSSARSLTFTLRTTSSGWKPFLCDPRPARNPYRDPVKTAKWVNELHCTARLSVAVSYVEYVFPGFLINGTGCTVNGTDCRHTKRLTVPPAMPRSGCGKRGSCQPESLTPSINEMMPAPSPCSTEFTYIQANTARKNSDFASKTRQTAIRSGVTWTEVTLHIRSMSSGKSQTFADAKAYYGPIRRMGWMCTDGIGSPGTNASSI